MHADHLCSPDAHLGNWPAPPQNAILAPPFLSACQLAKLGSRRSSNTGKTEDEKQSKLVPIVDVGPDFEADEGLCGSGDGAAELAWPLPIQAPLEAMPPCMEFYQVRRKQVTLSLTRIHGYNIFSFFAVIEFSPCSGARRPPLHPRSSPWQLASSSSKLHPCPSLLSTLPDSRTP